MNKIKKIRSLTSNKVQLLTFSLNPDLIALFKKACKANNTRPTSMLEDWIIDYIDENNLLEFDEK